MKKNKSGRITMQIDKDLLQWIDEQIKDKQFENHSAGIRRCIEIARRVYKNATPEEMAKFILGRNIER